MHLAQARLDDWQRQLHHWPLQPLSYPRNDGCWHDFTAVPVWETAWNALPRPYDTGYLEDLFTARALDDVL